MKKRLLLSLIGLASLMISCQDDLSLVSQAYMTQEQLENLMDASPEKLVKGLDGLLEGNYYKMILISGDHDEVAGQAAINIVSDVMSEDVVAFNANWFNYDYLHRYRTADDSRTETIWGLYYGMINDANMILNYINRRADVKDNKEVIATRGQALAQRAYAYFCLIRLYQHTYVGSQDKPGVPLYTETKTGKENSRNTAREVYDQILSDLEQAYGLLDGYSRPPRKTNIDQKVVAGLRARVFLAMENWAEAARYAALARSGYPPMSEAEYKKGFSDLNLSEVIWGGKVTPENTPYYGSFFSHMSNTDVGGYAYGGQYKLIWRPLYDKIPETDYRKEMFNDPQKKLNPNLKEYANLKFFSGKGDFSGDVIWMRSSEMYLIEAEANARSGRMSEAQAALNALVRQRDPAFKANQYSGEALIDQILLQRRIELWGEGFAWFDAKRLRKDINRTSSNPWLKGDDEKNNHPVSAQFEWKAGSNDFCFQIPIKVFETGGLSKSEQNPL